MATSAERKETRGSEGVPAHLLFVMLAPRFPPTYPPEAILENMTIEPILKLNIRHIVAMHPNWRVIVDNDKTCIERIELAISDGLFSDRMSTYWWWNLETQQKWPAFRSDLCRLVQLHYDGGMYLDTDIELLRPLGIDLLGSRSVTASVDLAGRDIVQSILAAPARSQLIRRNIAFFDEIMRNMSGASNCTQTRSAHATCMFLRGGLIGPRVMARSVEALYGRYSRWDGQPNPAALEKLRREKNVELLREVVSHNRSVVKGRHRGMMCNIAMYNTTTKELVAFARVRRQAQSVAAQATFGHHIANSIQRLSLMNLRKSRVTHCISLMAWLGGGREEF